MEPLLIALALAGGACAGVLLEHGRRRGRIGGAEREAERILEDARRQADAQVKEARVTAREELLAQRTEQERDLAERGAEIIKIEERLAANQGQLESTLEDLARRDQSISDREAHAKQLQEELKAARDAQVAELEKVAGMTASQGRDMLMAKIEEECRGDMAKLVRRIEEEARLEADKRARNILSVAIQRTASGHTAETTVSVVQLASDDLKGRIIGREGRTSGRSRT
jgi:ribonuclease Y